jgi:hypothetical protein
VLQAWILVAENQDNDDYGGQADHDRETGTENNQRDSHQWTHFLFPNW